MARAQSALGIANEPKDYLNTQYLSKSQVYNRIVLGRLAMECTKVFSQNLIKHRSRRKMSQRRLGDMCGVNPATISYWESGKHFPASGDVFDRLAKALRIDLWRLFYRKKEIQNAVAKTVTLGQ